MKNCCCSLAGTEACEKCLQNQNETPFFNNYKPDFYKKNTDGVMDLPNPYNFNFDNKVFKLAEKIKQDILQLKQDYKNGQMSLELLTNSIVDSQVILDHMANIWDVNLEEYSNIIDLD